MYIYIYLYIAFTQQNTVRHLVIWGFCCTVLQMAGLRMPCCNIPGYTGRLVSLIHLRPSRAVPPSLPVRFTLHVPMAYF